MIILFLDIDGVLNTGQYNRYMIENNLNDFDENGSIFDPNAVDNLRLIIDSTHADIIISSTWRYDGLDKIQNSSFASGFMPFSSPNIVF